MGREESGLGSGAEPDLDAGTEPEPETGTDPAPESGAEPDEGSGPAVTWADEMTSVAFGPVEFGPVEAASVDPASGAPDSMEPESGEPAPRLMPALVTFTALRVGLMVALTALLMLAGSPVGLPLIVALAFAVILQLPLSVLLFPKQRRTLTAALAHAKAARTAERDRLHRALTGEEPRD